MKALLLAAALSALSFSAHAQTVTDGVPGHDGVSYFDLLQQVIPDLSLEAGGATGHLPAEIPHLEGADMAGELPDPATATSLETVTVKSGGKQTLWIIVDLGEGGNLGTYTLLSVFDDAPTPKLLAAVEIDTDQLTGFVGSPIAISDDDEAMMVGSEHFNSNQSYQSRMLAFLHDGKLKLIDSFFAFGVRSCDEVQTEDLTVAAKPSDTEFWPIAATITRHKALAGQDCEDPEPEDFRHRDFTATYVWNPVEQRYDIALDELSELAEQDSALF